jgi:CRISPR/Cas system-associated exonuclease Cas4 (RecB family)
MTTIASMRFRFMPPSPWTGEGIWILPFAAEFNVRGRPLGWTTRKSPA